MTLEELMNKLIKMGWKPFRKEEIEEVKMSEQYQWKWTWCFRWKGFVKRWKSTRDICSKESQLWQFVCENGMVNANNTPEENAINYWRYNKKDLTEWWYMRNYQYRLIESSLKDESELEQFLLDNINVD